MLAWSVNSMMISPSTNFGTGKLRRLEQLGAVLAKGAIQNKSTYFFHPLFEFGKFKLAINCFPKPY
jgi:hypothetical protein